jgi:hypothetical protein
MNKYITAVLWYFGMNKKEACAYIKGASPEVLRAIVAAFEYNARAVFYND